MALNAKWAHIDLEHRVWRLPAAGNKVKKTQSVPLNVIAVAVLKENQNNGSEFCFPNPKTGNKPYVTITRVWHRIREEAGLSNFRIHDVRHSYASFLANSGRTLDEIQQILGHAEDSRVTQRYAHLSASTLKAAANSASDKITAAMDAASGEN